MYKKALNERDVPAMRYKMWRDASGSQWWSHVELEVRTKALEDVKREDIMRDIFHRAQPHAPHSLGAHLRFNTHGTLAGWTWPQYHEQCDRAFKRLPRYGNPYTFHETPEFRAVVHPPGVSTQQSKLLETAVLEHLVQLQEDSNVGRNGHSWLDAELYNYFRKGWPDYPPHHRLNTPLTLGTLRHLFHF